MGSQKGNKLTHGSTRKIRGQAAQRIRFDKDHKHITTDDTRAVPYRSFFVGEFFWVDRHGWESCGGFSTNATRDHHPGLVVRQQRLPYQPVDMVPGTTKVREQDGVIPMDNFIPEEDISWTVKDRENSATLEQGFVLNYRRPVRREYIGHHVGTLHYQDKERLIKLATAVERQGGAR